MNGWLRFLIFLGIIVLGICGLIYFWREIFIFSTSSKPKAGPPKGTQIISQVKEFIKIPLVAIGGINLDNIDKTLEAGADGIAVIKAVFQETDVGLATRRLSKRIRDTILKCSL